MDYGTCGHKLTRGYESLALRAVEHDFNADCLVNKVSYVVYCKPCARRMRKIKMVLENQDEIDDWLTIPVC
jgi:hypothetical protein